MAQLPSRKRVSDGAKFLDARFPNWARRVNEELLSLVCPKRDVLGQLYGNYWIGRSRLKITDQGCEQMGFHTIFHIGHPERSKEESLLTEAWKREIVNRKSCSIS